MDGNVKFSYDSRLEAVYPEVVGEVEGLAGAGASWTAATESAESPLLARGGCVGGKLRCVERCQSQSR